MAPRRAPKQPIPQKKKPGLQPKPGVPDPNQAPKPLPQQVVQHKPWSTSVKGGSRGH